MKKDGGSLGELIAKVGDLPAMPTIAVRVMELVGDPTASANDLQKMISKDQALTAKVLTIANSAMFGVARDITTLSHAIVILGFSTIRSVVLAASTKSIYFRAAHNASFSAKLLWEHSLACALVARRIAERSLSAELEEAFITGLLHDVGKSVLNTNFTERYTAVVLEAMESVSDFQTVEQSHLGFDHTQVGALVVRKWNLSRDLEQAILNHHAPERDQGNAGLTATVALANQIVNHFGVGPIKKASGGEMNVTPAASAIGLDQSGVDELVEGAKRILEQDRDIFSL